MFLPREYYEGYVYFQIEVILSIKHCILNIKIIVLFISDTSSFLHREQNASFKLVEVFQLKVMG